jgi:hypothetical protein
VEATDQGFSLIQERFLQSGDLKPEEDMEIWCVRDLSSAGYLC